MSEPEDATHSGEEAQNARYECDCGNAVEVQSKNFDKLRWATKKFGYRNPAELIQAESDCCDRPSYMEVSLWSDPNVQ